MRTKFLLAGSQDTQKCDWSRFIRHFSLFVFLKQLWLWEKLKISLIENKKCQCWNEILCVRVFAASNTSRSSRGASPCVVRVWRAHLRSATVLKWVNDCGCLQAWVYLFMTESIKVVSTKPWGHTRVCSRYKLFACVCFVLFIHTAIPCLIQCLAPLKVLFGEYNQWPTSGSRSTSREWLDYCKSANKTITAVIK